MRLVIGAGADATRAAACLAATGQAVLLLRGCDSACGLSHPTLPEGTGQIRVPGGMQSTIESVTGPLISKDTIRRVVAARGHRTAPDGIEDVPRLFGADALPGVGQQFLERRVRNALVPLTGEGQEERTYRQWVERRMGHGAYSEHVYADYACAAGGCQESRLAVGLARLHHNPHESDTMAPSDGGHEGMHQAAVALIEATAERFAQASTCRVSKWSMGGCLPSKSGVATRQGRRPGVGCTSACCRGGLAR